MIIWGSILSLLLPLCVIGYFATAQSIFFVGSMLGAVTLPVGIVMLIVGIMTRKKYKKDPR
jgi:hypothetical protein